eukprot:TRINITY_DN2965_c0_g1_i3.p1 TRINITY_DN2965_c0_g1~~TRINITY_DN2965_c0_g1_i3.p1  ORF type:complete len:136 (+),score=23.24 TRINITY_DN2965_c0_g1_i3:86-493(+)
MASLRLLCIVLFALHCVSVLGSGLKIGVKFRPEKCDRKTKPGDSLSIHYTGTLTDGTQFDSSVPRNQPFTFTLGAGQVIKGWDQGLVGMCVGEKRKLTIPYELAYGESGRPPTIPPKATLIFETCLLYTSPSPRD